MGDIGASNLYGQYADYQSFGLDVGVRRYRGRVAGFAHTAKGRSGWGWSTRPTSSLVAPAANVAAAPPTSTTTPRRSRWGNAGVVFQAHERATSSPRLGLRWVSGMSSVDDLEGTGLETINDKSARWTIPFLVGVRARF